MAAAVRASQFLNRTSEREHLDTLLAGVRAGHSAALVLRGEAGVGKTALLRYAERQALGFRAAQTAGVEGEMELPFAGVHRLCAPMLDPRPGSLRQAAVSRCGSFHPGRGKWQVYPSG